MFALERWAKAHPPYDPSASLIGVDYLARDWDSIRRDASVARSLDEIIVGNLDVEEFSDLEALFYTGRETDFGENYEESYRRTLEKNRLEKPLAYVHHLMCKTNLLDEVVKGCAIVGRPSLGARLRAIRP